MQYPAEVLKETRDFLALHLVLHAWKSVMPCPKSNLSGVDTCAGASLAWLVICIEARAFRWTSLHDSRSCAEFSNLVL